MFLLKIFKVKFNDYFLLFKYQKDKLHFKYISCLFYLFGIILEKNKSNFFWDVINFRYHLSILNLKNYYMLPGLNFKLLGNVYKNLKYIFVSYIIKIVVSKVNIFVNITDITGKSIFFYSSGQIGFKGKYQLQKNISVFKVTKLLLAKLKFLKKKNVSLHLTGLNNYLTRKLIKIFKKVVVINNIRVFSVSIHNGCRLRKIKNKK